MVVENQFRLGFRNIGCRPRRTLLKFFEGVFHLNEQFISHCSREAMPDQNALDHKIFAIRRHGVCGHKPSARAQSIGKIVKRKSRRCGIFQFPAEPGNSAAAIVDDFEWTERFDPGGELPSKFSALVLDFAIAFFAEAEEVVILANNLPARA